MFNTLLSDLILFVEERDWMQYHSPQNMATALFVETSELLEHFLPNAALSREELENELGDVLNCILLTMEALNIKPPPINIEYNGSGNPLLELSVKLRKFMDHFLWIRKGESYRGELSDLSRILHELLTIHFSLCKELDVDPFKACYTKLELNKKKYPIELVKGPVDNYFNLKKALQKKPS